MTYPDSEDEAFRLISDDILRFVGPREWTSAGGKYRVLELMIASEWWVESDGGREEGGGGATTLAQSKLKAAAIRFLRDDLLKKTGDRIWALTFTLFPDGKFKVEYDYNKPEGYEEGDETVDFSQAIENLQNQGLKVEKE